MITDDIAEKAARVADGAEALKARIIKFEAWLGTLKGRTETLLDDPEIKLFFKREGKEWTLFVLARNNEWVPLKDASLNLKLRSIKAFDDLLLAMEETQEQLIHNLNQAAIDFDKRYGELL